MRFSGKSPKVVVEFCDDGGQACVPGTEVFPSMKGVRQFAKPLVNEWGHIHRPRVLVHTEIESGAPILLGGSIEGE